MVFLRHGNITSSAILMYLHNPIATLRGYMMKFVLLNVV